MKVRVTSNGRWFRVEVGYGADPCWMVISDFDGGYFPTKLEAQMAADDYLRKYDGEWTVVTAASDVVPARG